MSARASVCVCVSQGSFEMSESTDRRHGFLLDHKTKTATVERVSEVSA